ncbi:MAG: glucosamine-6-phosphate deaminase [Kiritimatiellae bacterium]|nr:glucosamine-6-phosphate deaminase [Kiritimatiellia bacterium]
MKVIIVKDKEEMGRVAADFFAREMTSRPHPVLGLATGSTPLPLYKELVRRHKEEGLDFSRVTTFNLDEYVGLEPTHDQSYRYFMNTNLFDHINVRKEYTFVPNGMANNIERACAEYEHLIDRAGGIDLQILGIGANGHIAFNEPGSSLGSLTRVKTLTEKTRQDNARFFKSMDEVPKLALTMGIGSILRAHKVILLASGANKAGAVKNALEGPVSAMCPASALQLHRNALYIVTKDAAAKLTIECERPEVQAPGLNAWDWEYQQWI